MENYKWNSSLAIGNFLIDKQHQNIIDLTNKLIQNADAKAKSEAISEILRDLWIYYTNHFKEEEKLLEELNYPKLEAHRKLHESFTIKVAHFNKDVLLMKPDVIAEMIKFLGDWFIHHISTADQDYKKYL